MKQIDAGLLNIGYAEDGPANGPAVILLHGWPYDIYSFVDVVPLLAAKGYRVIIPFLRGYGTTKFLSDKTFRNGQQSVVAVDIIALDGCILKFRKRLSEVLTGEPAQPTSSLLLWPERCKGTGVCKWLSDRQPGSRQESITANCGIPWWYQFYFATERGQSGYEKYRHDFSKLIWKLASPKWNFDDATFDRTAASFNNPDHVAIVIHNYRWRLGLAEG